MLNSGRFRVFESIWIRSICLFKGHFCKKEEEEFAEMGQHHPKVVNRDQTRIEEEGGTHIFELHMPSAGLSVATVLIFVLCAWCIYMCFRHVPRCCDRRGSNPLPAAYYSAATPAGPRAVISPFTGAPMGMTSVAPMGLPMAPAEYIAAMHALGLQTSLPPLTYQDDIVSRSARRATTHSRGSTQGRFEEVRPGDDDKRPDDPSGQENSSKNEDTEANYGPFP